MLSIEQLSYWERQQYFDKIDFLIIGAGITGYNCALTLREKFPKAKILIVERGFLPSGASTKNAGFSCFGSATELIDDLQNLPSDDVWKTVEMRWKGLEKLRLTIDDKNMDLKVNGSWDLITKNEINIGEEALDKLPYLNKMVKQITGVDEVYSQTNNMENDFGFKQVLFGFKNKLEGQIDTGKLMHNFYKLVVSKNINCLFGVEVNDFISTLQGVELNTNIGEIKTTKLAICTNGFARKFLPTDDILPARAQVLITEPIQNLKLKGTFHYQQGYYYFRNIHDRILLGGGRNLNKNGETTTNFGQTEQIQNALLDLLSCVILPGEKVQIAHSWSGIMGVGKSKKPIIKSINQNVAVGVRLGGMGVAIGSLVGEKVADLLV